ncbi:MAG: hypothetical protein GC153_05955 [Alphaproteobacteria bacterium]|nr:hypothetical protein [Alphaproteobacteria bacterium]
MRLRSILLGAAVTAIAASAAATDAGAATILQLGAHKTGAASGVTTSSEKGVTVYRAAPLREEAAPALEKKIVEKRIIIEKRTVWPVKHVRTVGFYSGHPGHTRRFTQGFYSGPPDYSSCD